MRWLILFLLIFVSPAKAQEDIFLKSLQEELNREYEVLKKNNPPVYYLSYRAEETKEFSLESTLGYLNGDNATHLRKVSIQIRVGSPEMDNTHEIKGAEYSSSMFMQPELLPIENNEEVIKKELWRITHKELAKALERYQMVKANESVMAKSEDQSPDYTLTKPFKDIKQINFIAFNKDKWKQEINKISLVFRGYPDIYYSNVFIQAVNTIKYYVDSSGTILRHPNNYIRLYISCFTRSDDGMPLFLHESYSGFREEDLPDENSLIEKTKNLAEKLIKLRKAPAVEPYVGPAIFLPKATGVFFHEVMGHRLEGHRQKSEKEGQTFTKKINQKILPSFITIVDDPTLQYFQNKPLLGYYNYDDEGVKAQEAKLVEDGVLKGFLMSRSPIKDFPNSNGHGRGVIGALPIARQANLIIKAKETVPFSKLKEMLIEECKKQKKPYGLIFADVSGGFTLTGRILPQAFKVIPLEVYKIYTDGRPDELVRGVDIVGTPLSALEKIQAASDDYDVFNGFCGAESGFIPVSATAPAILVKEIEVEKKEKDMKKPPILPSPFYEAMGDKK